MATPNVPRTPRHKSLIFCKDVGKLSRKLKSILPGVTFTKDDFNSPGATLVQAVFKGLLEYTTRRHLGFDAKTMELKICQRRPGIHPGLAKALPAILLLRELQKFFKNAPTRIRFLQMELRDLMVPEKTRTMHFLSRMVFLCELRKRQRPNWMEHKTNETIAEIEAREKEIFLLRGEWLRSAAVTHTIQKDLDNDLARVEKLERKKERRLLKIQDLEDKVKEMLQVQRSIQEKLQLPTLEEMNGIMKAVIGALEIYEKTIKAAKELEPEQLEKTEEVDQLREEVEGQDWVISDLQKENDRLDDMHRNVRKEYNGTLCFIHTEKMKFTHRHESIEEEIEEKKKKLVEMKEKKRKIEEEVEVKKEEIRLAKEVHATIVMLREIIRELTRKRTRSPLPYPRLWSKQGIRRRRQIW